ncbi:MAG: hypothetical protein ACOYO1_02445 [Bacteroidales bacterium]
MLEIYKQQETCRLSEDDLQLIHEYYEQITNKDTRIPIGNFLAMAVVKASQVAGPKIIQDPKLLEENQRLTNELLRVQNESNANGEAGTGLQFQVDSLTSQLEQRDEQLRVFLDVMHDNSIVLNFDEKQGGFIKAALEIYKRDKVCETYEEMFWSIIANFQKAGYLKFDAADIEYLKNLNKPENE